MGKRKETPEEMDAAIPKQDAMGATTDEALIQAVREGDFQAYEVLYERHRLAVYRFIYQMVQRQEEAEDITQEAFVRAFTNLHKFQAKARFSTWITRIALNLCTDRIRMSQRRSNLEQKEAQGGLEWMTMANAAPSPVEKIEQERRARIVRDAIAQLPEHHRTAIVMRDLEGKDYEEIGEVFGCSNGGAKLRVLRARRALRKILEPLLEEGMANEVSNDEA